VQENNNNGGVFIDMNCEQKIRDIIAENLKTTENVLDFDADESLQDIGLDSISFVRIVIDIENAFKIEFADNKLIITESGTINNANTNTCVFGMDCYAGIRNRLKYARANGHWAAFWRQAFYIIWEHKRVMLGRMHYMQKNEAIDNIDPVINLYEKVEQSARIALSLAIKYSLTGKANIITDIATLSQPPLRCLSRSIAVRTDILT
jgi:acyl carrier protein